MIAPVVEAGKREGIFVEGPFPADTVFLRAKSGAFDAVLSMYHDQGQIAMKLMGFDRGVTLLGGFRFPICTPAHGTAYDRQRNCLSRSDTGRHCCSQLKWPCGGKDWLLPAVPTSASLARRRSAGGANNESIGS